MCWRLAAAGVPWPSMPSRCAHSSHAFAGPSACVHSIASPCIGYAQRFEHFYIIAVHSALPGPEDQSMQRVRAKGDVFSNACDSKSSEQDSLNARYVAYCRRQGAPGRG